MELRKCGNVSDAVAAAGVGRSTVYEWREADPDFRQQWDDALDEAVDSLEREAWRRARDGVQEPVIGRVGRDQDGQIIGDDGNPLYIRKYSDTLMTTLLKAHRPDKYRERVDANLNHSGNIQIEYVNDWRDQ
ncbi:MAG TPA: hypothetical protein VFZ66_29855 [Herpetosiphonaceae bacterium]